MSRQIKKFVKNLTDYNLPDIGSLETKVNIISGNVDVIADALNTLEVPDKVSELENDLGFIKRSELYSTPSDLLVNQDDITLLRGNFYFDTVQNYNNVVAVIDLTKVTTNKLVIKFPSNVSNGYNLGIKLTSDYFGDRFWEGINNLDDGSNIYWYFIDYFGKNTYNLSLDYTIYGRGEYAIDITNHNNAKALLLTFWDYAFADDNTAFNSVRENGIEVWQAMDGILTPIINDVEEINDRVDEIDDKIDELQLYKFPNATIFGQPTIQNGQVSNFSNNNYLQFPFLVDFQNKPFEIDFSFTTGNDISGQQNILDSNYGLAFATRSDSLVVVASEDGTTWSTGELIESYVVSANTTYYIKILWNSNVLQCSYSLDKSEWHLLGMVNMSNTPYPKTMYIGRSYVNNGNYFKGSINLNDASLTIAQKVVWTGMDDVGLATRAAVDLSNIDDKGKEVIDNRIDNKIVTKQDTLVSGTNIKTINNQSILGEGNITIQGGGSSNIVNLTQAEYDALETKDPNTIYNITDATDIDVYTKEEIDDKGYLTHSDVYTKEEIDALIPDVTKYLPTSGGTLTGHLTLGSTAETSFKKVEAIRNTNNQANGAAFYVNGDGTSAFFHKAYNGASATNDAILRFDATRLQFAKGGTRGTNATTYYDVMTSDVTYNKTEIDNKIGDIETLLSQI